MMKYDIKHDIKPTSFIEMPILADEYLFGSNQLGGEPLRLDGDWRKYIPKYESQYRNGVEPMSCTTFGTQNAISILTEEQFNIPDEDYSARYTAKLSGTTRMGNNPHKVAETIRSKGLIYESEWPIDKVTTWDEYYADIPTRLKLHGKSWTKNWNFKHDWVITKDTPLSEVNERLFEALKFSPIGVSVNAWVEDNGVYIKRGRDNHWCLLIYKDKDYNYVLDSYAPYIKKLEPNYHFSFAKRYTLTHRERLWFLSLLGL